MQCSVETSLPSPASVRTGFEYPDNMTEIFHGIPQFCRKILREHLKIGRDHHLYVLLTYLLTSLLTQ
jgi:hypothetical protein